MDTAKQFGEMSEREMLIVLFGKFDHLAQKVDELAKKIDTIPLPGTADRCIMHSKRLEDVDKRLREVETCMLIINTRDRYITMTFGVIGVVVGYMITLIPSFF